MIDSAAAFSSRIQRFLFVVRERVLKPQSPLFGFISPVDLPCWHRSCLSVPASSTVGPDLLPDLLLNLYPILVITRMLFSQPCQGVSIQLIELLPTLDEAWHT
jgi:hypothetical protein